MEPGHKGPGLGKRCTCRRSCGGSFCVPTRLKATVEASREGHSLESRAPAEANKRPRQTGTTPRGNPPEGKRRDFPWASILRAPQGEGANNSPIWAQGTSWVTRPTVQRHFLGLQAQPIPGFKERPLKIVPPSDLLCGNSVSPGDGPQGFALLDHVIRVSLLVGS